MKKRLNAFIFLVIFFLPFQLNAQTFEGKGANSPEEAVIQYLNALKVCDYSKIISCYSIETFVENYDIEQYIKKLNGATQTMKMIYPNDNLLKQTAKFEVLDSIIKMIKYQIWTLNENDFFQNGNVVLCQNNYQEIVNKVFPSNAEKRLSKIKFTNKFISTDKFLIYLVTGDFNSDISDYEENVNMFKENAGLYYEKTKKIYGCSDVQDIVAKFSINGKKYYFISEIIKYGNKWYISPNQGFLACLLGISVSRGCIINKNLVK